MMHVFLCSGEPLNPGSTGSVQSSATFVVQRAAGAFGPAIVYWSVSLEQNDTTDIAPVEGTTEFNDGDRTASFEISALPDQVSMQQKKWLYVRSTLLCADHRGEHQLHCYAGWCGRWWEAS